MITEFKVAQLLDLRVLELVFRIESGVVVDTEQRSDSHVYGSGYTMNWNGTGGGSSYVATRVSVNRDIFVKDAADREAHIRVNFDLPCRKASST
ncbi:MAG: hypothetical protein IPO00_06855 [Betaproteobacteria bacterium]|nr:hypothetical protein [Betaproteobacteria bacterium]